jgi:SnoaL-like domain
MRLREMWREVITHVPDFHIELVEVVADGADIVVVGVNFLGMGWASGADISTTVYQAVSFRDGKVAIVQGFRTAPEALEAVGAAGVGDGSLPRATRSDWACMRA